MARTVAALDAAPDAVLCNGIVDYIDETGTVFANYTSVLGEAGGADPAERFAAMALRSHSCVDFFGMIRREAMVGSLLHASFHGADRVFLVQMALRGRLLQLPEPLVQMREHRQRYTRNHGDARARQLWHDSSGKRTAALPTLYMYGQYLRLVQTEQLTPAAHRRCLLVLARWWVSNWNAIRVATDAMSLLVPGIVGHAERVKTRLFGAAPGSFPVLTAAASLTPRRSRPARARASVRRRPPQSGSGCHSPCRADGPGRETSPRRTMLGAWLGKWRCSSSTLRAIAASATGT